MSDATLPDTVDQAEQQQEGGGRAMSDATLPDTVDQAEQQQEDERIATLSARILELEQQLAHPAPLATLAERLCAVRANLQGAVPKRGQMVVQGQKVDYVKHDDLCEHIRVVMAEQGVDFRPHLEPDREIVERLRQTKMGTRTEYRVWVRMSLIAGTEREEFWWVGEGATIPIATTFAVKYFLLKLLVLAGGDDSDEAASEEQSTLQQPAKTAPPPQTSVSDAKRQYNQIKVSEPRPVKKARKPPEQQQLIPQDNPRPAPAEDAGEVPLPDLRQQLWRMVQQLSTWRSANPQQALAVLTEGTSLRESTREQCDAWIAKIEQEFWEEQAKHAKPAAAETEAMA